MRKIIVKIDREKAIELERINFELGFTKDVIQRLIDIVEHHNNGDTVFSV